jgi:quinol monooxygenase YgiN
LAADFQPLPDRIEGRCGALHAISHNGSNTNRKRGLPMLLIVGTIRLPPENLGAARSVMARMVELSRDEDGCLEYSYAEDVLESGLIHVKELWRDQPSLDRHFQSAHLSDWRAAWPALGIHGRNLKSYEVGEARET